MDSDRKSTVSSFYGGRKGSLDALNQDFPSPTTGDYAAQQRPRGDDASSFFDPEQRRSTDPLAGRAGYNRGSFFQPGREEPLKGGRDEEDPAGPPDGAWDVYADFNNAGPKYSSAFGAQDTGYHSLGGGSTPKVEESAGPVELVTVPALGAEWKKSELRDMTKAGKRERQAESRRAWWRRFTRGDRAGRWRRITVFVCFALIVVIAIIVGICIPRVPSFAVSNATPLGNATGAWAAAVPTSFSRVPANFSFPAFADLQVDTDSNYLPLHFTRLRAQVFDLDSGFLVGTGDLGRKTLPAKAFPDIQIPINFTYLATNDSDTTWLNWYDACKNLDRFSDGKRPGLRFKLVLNMVIIGLPGSYGSTTVVPNAPCPIELPSSSV